MPPVCLLTGLLIAQSLSIASCTRTPPRPTAETTLPQHVDSVTTAAADEGSAGRIATIGWEEVSWKPDQPERDWQYIVIHHSATQRGSVESIHRAHLARKDANGNPWRGIGYHFVIGNGHGMSDGAVEPTFRWHDQLAGAHAGDATYNEAGIGICLVGNFEKHPPTAAQLRSLTTLTRSLSSRYEIPVDHIKRHGELKSTACPGKFFPMQKFRNSAVVVGGASWTVPSDVAATSTLSSLPPRSAGAP